MYGKFGLSVYVEQGEHMVYDAQCYWKDVTVDCQADKLNPNNFTANGAS